MMAVQILYLDLVVRFYRFFIAQPDYLPSVLWIFLDHRGLYNTNTAVRGRASYLLLRFVKQTLKSATSAFIEVVHQLLKMLRQQPAPLEGLDGAPASATVSSQNGVPSSGGSAKLTSVPTLSESEQMCVYETCGLLLGAGLAPVEQVSELLSGVLELPLSRLEMLCTVAGEVGMGSEADQQRFTERAFAVARQIALTAVLSKGFVNLGADASHRSLRDHFSRAAQLALSALTPYGCSTEVRSKTLMLLHRMVETLDERVIDFFGPALPQLLSSAEPREVQEVFTLVSSKPLRTSCSTGLLTCHTQAISHPSLANILRPPRACRPC
ncbi:MAG: hypothetical protein SGPRY_000512 [Prymnesium sp.]